MEPQLHPNASGRELELELIRVRAEAAAARLEARAAQLELMLLAQRQQTFTDNAPPSPHGGHSYSSWVIGDQPEADHSRQDSAHESLARRSFASDQEDAAQSLISAIQRLMEQRAGEPAKPAPATTGGNESTPTAAGNGGRWESRLIAARRRGGGSNTDLSQPPPDAADISLFAARIAMASQAALEPTTKEPTSAVPSSDSPMTPTGTVLATREAPSIRVDSANKTVKRPRMLDTVDQQSLGNQAPVAPARLDVGKRPAMRPIPVTIAEAPTDEYQPKRWRPAGWLISTTAHVVGLLVLGLFTLANPKPKDQLAFTASVSEASETMVESFSIETAEEMPDVAEPTPTETAADVSPLGTMQLAEVSLDLPTAAAPPTTTALSGDTSSESMKLAKASVKGDTPSKVQFAGLDGGGNHFVYLVDSSNSMKKFNDARTELLRSIDSLKPDQRFYVVFYDENPKFMRVTSPSQDESASVYASPENKQAFRRWAMAVQQARGQSPPEVLKFAFKLRPDVIFLLSDGEFTAQTETVIRENNLQENLFGESGPISIIHTIRYPGVSTTEGRQAEIQMQRIAAENGGQYRNVEIK